MVGEHRISAFDHGAGEARDAAKMERHPRRLDVPVVDLRDLHHSKRHHLERSLVRSIAGGQLVRCISDNRNHCDSVSGHRLA
jgi:hypothetical protein